MIDKLSNICSIYENSKIKNTLNLDCTAHALAKPKDEGELLELIKAIKSNNYRYMIIGNASNIILPPYYDGVIIKLDNFNNYKVFDDYVYAECGVMLNKLSLDLVNMGYAGLDFACGVPGSIGGSVYGNAGCYGSSISEVLISARVFDGENIVELSNSELQFGYRESLLKKNKNYIVLSCKIRINKSDVTELKELVQERTQKRMSSQDLTHPSNGSIFRNPEGASAGKLIDDLGLKGYSIGGASISKIHANFIINDGNATYKDVIALIDYIKKRVKEEYNIDLVLEQEIIEE